MNQINFTHNLGLFSTLVTVTKNIISNEEIKKIYEKCLEDESFSHEAIDINGTSTHSHDSNFIDSFPEIKQKVHNKFNEYCDQLNIKNVLISNSWFNIQNENSVLTDHTHPGSVLSAALYINVGEGSSPLYFYNPNSFIGHFFSSYVKNVEQGFDKNHKTTATVEFFKFIPSIGELIIFPSWLKHGSNKEKNLFKNRVVLSFNTSFI